MTGRASGYGSEHGFAPVWEFLSRYSLMKAHLVRLPDGRLEKAAAYGDLDRSEKVGVSYALGSAMAGLFGADVLGIARLLHVDRYAGLHNVRFVGRQRPDYFGLGRRGWIVMEAKGRSRGVESALVGKIRRQKRSVRSIEGCDPWLAVGTVAHFGSGELELDAHDPKELNDEIEPIDIPLDRAAFYRAHYFPFMRAIEFGERIDARAGYRVSSVGVGGLEIGLPTEIIGLLAAGGQVGDEQWSETLERLGQLSGGNDIDDRIMPDGTFFHDASESD